MTTSDVWLKMLLEKLIDRRRRVNSSICRGMSVATKANSCRSVFWGRVGMERPNDAVDERHIRIGRFTERINIGLVNLVACASPLWWLL